jgi:hypothetical protein
MAADAHDATLPAPFHRLVLPTLLGSLLSGLLTVLLLLKRRAQQPSLPRMSDEWLRSHQFDRDWEP